MEDWEKVKYIKEMIKIKEATHRAKYETFKVENAGHIMNGHHIMAECCKEILELVKDIK